jgi:sortase A
MYVYMKRLFKISPLLFAFSLVCFGKPQPVHDYSIRDKGVIVGHLEIPRIGISVPVLEGSGPNILAIAAGHIEGTSLPGLSGNMGIAAHRDTFFGPLRQIRPNDIITVRTMNGSFSYAVNTTEVVAPSEVGVLRQTPDAELTLVTCYPFRYKGPSPKRFIVHATRITDGDPSELGISSLAGQ